MRKNLDFRRIFQITATVSLIFVYLIQWMSMIASQPLRTGADFIHFYAAGRISQNYGFPSIYNISLQHEFEQKVVGFALEERQVLPYNHMPYLATILAIIVNDSYTGSFIRWAILMLSIYVAGSIFYIYTFFPKNKSDVHSTLIMGTLTFFPFFVSLLLGQDTALLFLGIALWCTGILKKQDWVAATGLAITSVRPHICLALVIPLLFKYRKIWWHFCLITSSLALTSILLIGREGTLDFLTLMRISAGGAWYGMNQPAMPNLIGLIWRTFPSADPVLVRSIGWLGYLIGIIVLSILWFKTPKPDERLLGMSIVIILFIAPHLHYHDTTPLILPLIFLVTLSPSQAMAKRIALLPLGISILMIPEAIRLVIPYLLYGALIWLLSKKSQSPSRQFAP